MYTPKPKLIRLPNAPYMNAHPTITLLILPSPLLPLVKLLPLLSRLLLLGRALAALLALLNALLPQRLLLVPDLPVGEGLPQLLDGAHPRRVVLG